MTVIILLQLLLPLVLIAWLLVKAPNSRLGYWAFVLAIGATIVALILAGIWMFPPWWLGYVYLAVFMLIVLVRLVIYKLRPANTYPQNALAYSGLALSIVIALLSTGVIIESLLARRQPPLPTVNIAHPFNHGTYLVANGGSREMLNAHMKTLDPTVPRFRAFRGGSHAIDLVKLNAWGVAGFNFLSSNPADYAIFSQPVVAPCNGKVIASRNNRPDMPVPVMDREVLEGNHVLLDCGNFVLLLAHLRQGSVRVTTGETVTIGDPLGEAGNSGNTAQPHLHIHAQTPGTHQAPLSGDPLVLHIDNRYLVRNARIAITKD